MKAPRVLLSAYQCGPGLGSVSQIGWEWYSRLARKTEVTLVTHIRNSDALKQAGAPLPGSEIVFIDTEWFAGPLYRTAARMFPRSQHAVFLISSLDFFVYDRQVVNVIRKRDVSGSWDIIHAPTPVSPIAATRLHRLGLPLIVGPWNGGLASPSGFRKIMQDDSGWIYRIRDLGRLIDRGIGCTKRAEVILTATKATDESVPSAYRDRIRRMIENGVDLSVFHANGFVQPPSRTQALKVLFVGRLIPVKGVSLLLRAVDLVKREVNLQVTVVGDGPLRGEIEAEIAERELGAIVTMTGNLPLPQVSAHMQASHLFCLPSIRESGGAVLLEAMACALPAVAVNYGGPAEILNGEVGLLLPSDGPESLIAALADVLRDAYRNPGEWHARGLAGQKRVKEEFDWDAKIDQAMHLYRRISSSGARHD